LRTDPAEQTALEQNYFIKSGTIVMILGNAANSAMPLAVGGGEMMQ
jgi:hypothetical protein